MIIFFHYICWLYTTDWILRICEWRFTPKLYLLWQKSSETGSKMSVSRTVPYTPTRTGIGGKYVRQWAMVCHPTLQETKDSVIFNMLWDHAITVSKTACFLSAGLILFACSRHSTYWVHSSLNGINLPIFPIWELAILVSNIISYFIQFIITYLLKITTEQQWVHAQKLSYVLDSYYNYVVHTRDLQEYVITINHNMCS